MRRILLCAESAWAGRDFDQTYYEEEEWFSSCFSGILSELRRSIFVLLYLIIHLLSSRFWLITKAIYSHPCGYS